MSVTSKTLPELGLIAVTRAALGTSIGLLFSNSLKKRPGAGSDLPLPRWACLRPARLYCGCLTC
jgi:hypothetical protein